ncbi:hypothetical protein IU438_25885 [Nocardia cyriacigeorgica]|uniref:hypothetical protein n=1 Tax=Nocardia cyriacigeorgica TaxID=135487 RepID=UPI0018957A4F|nr:hypothetical protein [Nocardia cyriacigeorgica]MBF6399214.1 hypothetical protein [Nocardia cyriacigeorgica]MBF6404845.1 hypothetical protein [Nocardia cyriacigeorgica]
MTEPDSPARHPEAAAGGGWELSQVLASLESFGLVHSAPLLPQRNPGRHVAGFGPAPSDYIGAPLTDVTRVTAAVREWASEPSRCRDESSPGTADLTDEPSDPAAHDAASVLLPPWLTVTPTAPHQISMLDRLYRLTRHPRTGRIRPHLR